jgi:putative ABC transport system permease protein
VLNDIHLMSGRYFGAGAQDEVILSERFARENGLEVGDRIKASIDSKKYSLRIVGLALSPEYIYMIRNIQELMPSPERFGILWVPEDFAETALDMKAACNNIAGTVDDMEGLDILLSRAEKILDPYGVIAKVKREDQISNRFISDEIKGLEVQGRIIPAIFQGTAALIVMVLLNRMVRKERTEIGLLKAYGHSDWTVAFHYVQYAVLLAFAGSVAGFGIGQWLANGLIALYVEFYDFPILRSRVYPEVLARSIGIAVSFSIAGAASAAYRAARIHPAESMRPEVPRFGHRSWLERFPVVWRRLSFTWKMIARNIARNPFRGVLSVSGAAVSTGLLFMGYFTMDSMNYMVNFQFEETQREDVKISLVTERGSAALHEIARLDHVRDAEPVLEYPFEVKSAWRTKDAAVIGLPRDARLQRLVNTEGVAVDIGDSGLVFADRLAEDLRVSVGDVVTLKPLTGRVTDERTAVVARIAEQYLGSSAYMNIDALSRLLNESFAMNAALVKTDAGRARDVNKALKDVPGVAAVAIKSDMRKNLEDTLVQSMGIMNTILIIFSAVIAGAIVYNITTVALAERQRELTSLRVLGFSPNEVGSILYYENFVLAVIGTALGVPLGLAICRLLVYLFDTELYRLPFYIAPFTYVKAVGLTLLFVALANWAVHYKIHRLDMVEVLKERE